MPTSPWTYYSEPVPDRDYLAVLTYLPLKRYRTIPRFATYTTRIRKQLDEVDGVLCYSLTAHLWKRDFWTLSVWEDEAHLRSFAFQGFHQGVMLVLKEDMGTFRNIRWSIPGSQLPPSWSEALERHRRSAV